MWARLRVPTRDVKAFRNYYREVLILGTRGGSSGELSLRQRERPVPKVCPGLPSRRDRLGLGWGGVGWRGSQGMECHTKGLGFILTLMWRL